MIDPVATTHRWSRPSSLPPCLVALLVLGLGSHCANDAGGQEPEYAQEYVQAFRGVPANSKDFSLTGADAEKCVKYEPEGLRITLPAGHVGDLPGTGLVTGFGVRGDFEITLSYEVLLEPAAADAGSSGTRLRLAIVLNTAGQNLTHFSRKMDMKAGPRFAAWVSTPDKNQPTIKGFPAKAKTGRLRLTRTGNVLSYFAAEGSDADFTLLQKFPFSTEDVREVRITGGTGGEKAALDIRITDLRIRAAALPKTFEPPAPPPLEAAPPPRDLPERVAISFRDGIDKQPLMRLFGPDAKALMTRNEQGMRFTLPNERRSNNPVGVESQLRLRGDFEITFAYELLALPGPPPPLGAGVELWVKFDTPNAARALLSRVQKPDGAFFVANHVAVGSNDKDNYSRLALRGAKEAKGQLRLVRTGKKLSYQIADGAADFHVFATKEFGAEDVIAARAWASTGWQAKSGVDTRFGHLEIRAEQILKSAPRDYPEGVEYQLREGIEKHPSLRFVGADAAAMAKTDAQGLRFLVPDDRQGNGYVGVESLKRLRGDFEITMQYELLNLPDPPPEHGAGVVVLIQLDTPDFFKAHFGRVLLPNGPKYGANYLVTGADGKEEFKGISVHPADEKQRSGSLRLVRTGKRVAYQIAEGPSGGFLTIETKDIGTADVVSARALCYTGWRSDVSVDIRLNSLELRADQMPTDKANPAAVAPDAPAAAPQEAASRSWLVALLIVALMLTVLLASAVGLLFFLRQRRQPGEIPLPRHKAKTAAVSPSMVVACPDCDKQIKVKSAFAGKKVKCPKCGQAVLVPATTEG